jgi:hypothetical protein
LRIIWAIFKGKILQDFFVVFSGWTDLCLDKKLGQNWSSRALLILDTSFVDLGNN